MGILLDYARKFKQYYYLMHIRRSLMIRYLIPIAFFCVTVCSASPSCCTPLKRESSPLAGDIELGYLMSTGNTETRSLNAKLSVAYTSERWRHQFAYETLYSYEEEEGTTAQRFLVSGQTNYRFDERNSAYALTLYENDRFAGYDYQLTASAGYSRQIIMSGRMEWLAEIGPGYRLTEFPENGGPIEEEAIIHFGSVFLYRFTDTTSFREELSVDTGNDNTIVRSVSSLRVMLRDHLSLRISYTIRHVADVPENAEKTDTETFVSLAYGF
jgi:putative salt-induced outer membrane protein